ncbi:type II toxin-antitoxin system HipA family toxin [Providencia rettgeri]|uniref:type II toxin-antitoxin system HipA family toxin n=1 Tax=Providencia rettgeri TaxID=587 RepID=UPI0034E06E27
MDNLEKITIEAYIDQNWVNIASIEFSTNFDLSRISYDFEYSLNHFDSCDNYAVSINNPVQLFPYDFNKENHFLDDLIPSGASRRFWVQHLDIKSLSYNAQNFILLKYATAAPIGNLRVRESINRQFKNREIFFKLSDVTERTSDFLDYANEKGGVAGGATGAGGEAPKLLLRYADDDHIWVDYYQDYSYRPDDLAYLVKYPRGSRSEIDCDILRTEYHYYHELESLGFDTIKTPTMKLLENSNQVPSLWLPRFDIQRSNSETYKLSVQSVYSILNMGPGSALHNEKMIRDLLQIIERSNIKPLFTREEYITEWINRDLLNVIFGNSDNHGRNTAFLLFNNQIKFAPIYDFAPMKADPEGIPRTAKWSVQYEQGGSFDYIGIAQSFSDLADTNIIIENIKMTAEKLVGLKERLRDRGVPERILDMPTFGFDFIPEKLAKWGLL